MSAQDELSRLIELERANISNKQLVKALVMGYVAAGGNLSNVRRIVQLGAEIRMQPKIDAIDFPGPDSMWTPVKEKIKGIAGGFVTEAFDDLVQFYSLQPLAQS